MSGRSPPLCCTLSYELPCRATKHNNAEDIVVHSLEGSNNIPGTIIVASNHTKIGAHFCCCSAGCCGSKGARRKQQKKKGPKNKQINKYLFIYAAFMVPAGRSVGRSSGPVLPAVSSAGWRVCYLHTRTPPPAVPFHCQHSTPHMPL